MTDNYKFEGGIKTLLIAFMVIGLISMGITFFGDDELHTRFWSNFLINSTFFTLIAFVALMFKCGLYMGFSGWQTVFKRLWESYSLFLLAGLILMLILGLGNFLGFHHLYHWNFEGISDTSSENYDKIIAGKSGFLNPVWYAAGTLIIVGCWYWFAKKIRGLSLMEDNNPDTSYAIHIKIKKYAAAFLPIAGFTSAALIWLWIMSVDAHWYSTLFAWYATISALDAMLSLTILTIVYLQSQGYLTHIKEDHMHDLGKYLFAFSIFWAYMWFSQYMLIWYGNIGEETIYFKERMDNYPVMFWGVFVLNFIVPFFILMINNNKRKNGTLIFTSLLVFLGHWLDYSLMIKPGVLHTSHAAAGHGGHGDHGSEATHEVVGHAAEHVSNFVSGFTLPGFLEIGTMLGFFGLFMFLTLRSLASAPLIPKNDPFLAESLHHHV